MITNKTKPYKTTNALSNICHSSPYHTATSHKCQNTFPKENYVLVKILTKDSLVSNVHQGTVWREPLILCCGATAPLGLGHLIVKVYRSHTIRHTHTHLVRLL